MRVSGVLGAMVLCLSLVAPARSLAVVIGVYFDPGALANEMIAVDGVAFDMYFIASTTEFNAVWVVGFSYALTVTAGQAGSFTRLAESLPPLDESLSDVDSEDPWHGSYFFACETPLPVVDGRVVLFSWQVMLSGDLELDVRLQGLSAIDPPAVVDGAGQVHIATAPSGDWTQPVAHISGVAGTTPVESLSYGQIKCIYR